MGRASMHEGISLVEEMLEGEVIALGLEGDGTDLQPISLPDRRELSQAEWKKVEEISQRFGRQLHVYSESEIKVVNPTEGYKRATDPSDIGNNAPAQNEIIVLPDPPPYDLDKNEGMEFRS